MRKNGQYTILIIVKLINLAIVIPACPINPLIGMQPTTNVPTRWANRSVTDLSSLPLSQDIHEVAQYVSDHLDSELSLKKVASVIYKNSSYLSRLFKRETGLNFSEYLIQKRVEKATWLLEQTAMSIEDIALSIGVANPQYFYKFFKRKTGKAQGICAGALLAPDRRLKLIQKQGVSEMKTILFQGDSITDCQRIRDDDRSTGQGYPNMVAGLLGYDQPGAYRVINRGVSGDRVVDVYARCKRDLWNMNPDYVSLLIGVNDVWHEFGSANGVDVTRYKAMYDMLLCQTLERLPDTQFILLEPFVLPGSGIAQYDYETFGNEVALRREVVRALAAEYKMPLVQLQAAFEEMAERLSPEYWLYDGVHPTAAGHGLITAKWMEVFSHLTNT